MYRPASSALVAEDTTFLMICAMYSIAQCLVGQLYCLKGRSAPLLGFVPLACLSSWRYCVLLTPCHFLHGRIVRHLPTWPDNWGVVVFVALCLQLAWMIVMLWHWLGKEGCYQLLCRGVKTCCIPVGWTGWLCHLTVAPLILVLRIVSLPLHHIGLVHSDMVHAVVCLLCVGIVSKLSACSLAWIDEPGVCYSPNPMLFQYTVCLSDRT